jgi:hypothetical protein
LRRSDKKEKENNVMNTNSKIGDADVIDHFVRKAHVERSLAFSAAWRLAVGSVKNIFSQAGAEQPATGRC